MANVDNRFRDYDRYKTMQEGASTEALAQIDAAQRGEQDFARMLQAQKRILVAQKAMVTSLKLESTPTKKVLDESR